MRAAVIAILAVLAACGEQAPEGERAARTAKAKPAEPVPPPVAVPAAAAPRLTLFADGIIVDGERAAPLRFGNAKAAVIAAVGTELGDAANSANAECGAGAMEFAKFGDLTLNFLDGVFVGWLAGPEADAVTVDGVLLGSTLGAIKRERSAALVSESTLEGEFEYASSDGGTIGGFLSGEGDEARVMQLYAGVNCFFR